MWLNCGIERQTILPFLQKSRLLLLLLLGIKFYNGFPNTGLNDTNKEKYLVHQHVNKPLKQSIHNASSNWQYIKSLSFSQGDRIHSSAFNWSYIGCGEMYWMSTGNFAWFGFVSFLLKYKVKNVQCFLLCLSVVNIYQSCYIWLSLMEGKRERDTFSLPSSCNEGVGVSALLLLSAQSPQQGPTLSAPGLDPQPFFLGQQMGSPSSPHHPFPQSLQHSSVFFSSAKFSRKG